MFHLVLRIPHTGRAKAPIPKRSKTRERRHAGEAESSKVLDLKPPNREASIFDLFATHEIGHELKAMSQWLDEHGDLLALVARDLSRHAVKATGRQGLFAEAVLRCALPKQYRQLSYQELAFHLEDSASFRAFARLPWPCSPQKSVLQKTISAIRPETWEEINRALLSSARKAKLEDGTVVRLDSTVTSALMHEPSDSSLLWDAVRVMVRLLKQADALIGGAGLAWRDHSRAAKKRARKIQFTRGRPNRVQLYRELIAIAHATLAYVRQAEMRLAVAANPFVELWQAGSSLSTADRTRHPTERAAGVGR